MGFFFCCRNKKLNQFLERKKMISLRNVSQSYRQSIPLTRMMGTGGEGSGPGGKSAGSIREAGGKFGEIEQAQEEAFFQKIATRTIEKNPKNKTRRRRNDQRCQKFQARCQQISQLQKRSYSNDFYSFFKEVKS